jgi:hypothetical protein
MESECDDEREEMSYSVRHREGRSAVLRRFTNRLTKKSEPALNQPHDISLTLNLLKLF